MKKVICPKCGNIFTVDEEHDLVDAENVVCPECKTAFNLYAASTKIDQQYKLSNSNGYRDLYKLRDYKHAYEDYAICLKLKDNDLSAIAGMIMAKVYGATMDKPNFNVPIELLEKYDIVLNPENSFIYLNLIRDLVYSCEQFLLMSKDNLMVNDVFISKDYFEMYINGVTEIKTLVKYFYDSLSLLDEEELKNFKEENKDFDGNLKIMHDGVETRLNKSYDVNGVGLIELKDGKEIKTTKKEYTLVVPEQVEMLLYPVNKKINKLKVYVIGTFSIMFIMIVGLLIAFAITKNFLYLYLLAIPVVLSIAAYYFFMYLYKKDV